MNTFLNWVQDQCGLKSRVETVNFLLLAAAGWLYFLYQYLYESGLSEAIPAYAVY